MFIQSAKSQLERLLELNARTHLRELPQGRSYRVSGNGCILRRRDNEAAQNVAAGNRDMEAEQSHTDKGILHRNSMVARRVTNDTSEHYGNP